MKRLRIQLLDRRRLHQNETQAPSSSIQKIINMDTRVKQV